MPLRQGTLKAGDDVEIAAAKSQVLGTGLCYRLKVGMSYSILHSDILPSNNKTYNDSLELLNLHGDGTSLSVAMV